jgi:diguanylate cyclase (GGDEF)-like protein/PAS domain S-box-containing protein
MRRWLGQWVLLAFGSALALEATLQLGGGTHGAPPPWILDGVLLGVLLQAPRSRRLAGLAAALLGGGLVWMLRHGDPTAGIVLAGGSITFQLVALGLLDRMGWRPADMASPRGLARGAVATLLLAPVLPALLTAAAGRHLSGLDFPGTLWRWSLTEVLGLAIVVPVVITLARRDLMLLFVPPLLTQTLSLLTLYAAVAGVVFLVSGVPLGFLVFPALLLLVGRLGFPGAGLGILVTTGMAVLAAMLHRGQFGLAPGASVFGEVTHLQVLAVTASAMVYPIAATVAERRRLSQSLSDQHVRVSRNQYLYRLLAENASDIITRVRLDGTRLYVSPSVTQVLGWTAAEMLRPDWDRLIHPEDLADFVAARERMRAGEEYITNTYRHRRHDGTWCWIEARLHLVRAADGTPLEFIANLRDISRQKEAEQALEAALAELAEQAVSDGLTDLANRRRFDAVLDQEWRRAMRAGEPIAIVLIDADHFKLYNDHYGHLAGDECLRALARAIGGQVHRPQDLAARYGGEEFAVILPGTTLTGAAEMAEKIRAAVEALAMPHDGNADGLVTVSIGVASTIPVDIGGGPGLVEAADRALYSAKRGGRNCVARAGASDNVVPLRAYHEHQAALAPRNVLA